MNNEELKKKFVEILEEGYTPIEYDDGDWGQTYFPTNEDVADALIAAGIGDESKYSRLAYEVRCNLTSVTRYIHNKNKQYNKKYKELAEKAVNNLLDLVNNHTQQAEKELEEKKR